MTSVKLQNQTFSLPVIEILSVDIKSVTEELQAFAPEEESEVMLPCVLLLKIDEVETTFIAQLIEVLRQVNLLPVGIQTANDELVQRTCYAGLAIFNDDMNSKPDFIHRGHVEAGEQIYAEGSSLVVLGDVKPGAEVIADGSIYVGGCLQGKAYAVNNGLTETAYASIRAYCFEPELISISGFYQLEEDVPKQYKGLAVSVEFSDQKLKYRLD